MSEAMRRETKKFGGETMEAQAAQGEILTSREARELLKIGRTKLWELTRKNDLPAYRIGKGKTSKLLYKRSELMAWLDQNRIG